MEQLLIQNACIIDGSGEKPFAGSLSLSDDRITGVYRNPKVKLQSHKTIDAGGKILAPGFVDTHTHSDMILLHDGRQPGSITQGVTTEIIGQDGLSYAPLSLENLRSYAQYLKGIDGMFDDVLLDFTTTAEYLSRFEGKSSVNVAYLIPHCALRLETAGFENRLLNPIEIEQAKRLLCDGINQGAKGLSTGLSYFPGAFSDTQELINFCETVAQKDGVYVTHLRTVFRNEPFDNVEEALHIARETGVKLHFSHYRTGGNTIGHTEAIMGKIDKAITEEGLDITLELYPYPYGASYAPMFVPMWASEGGVDKILGRLANATQRKKIAYYIDKEFSDFDGMISYAAEDPSYMGQTFGDLARQTKKTIGETVAELLYTQKLALSFHDVEPNLDSKTQELFEQDVFELLSRPYYMVGSDAVHIGAYPHPRAYGSFTKILHLARKFSFPLETLIERITNLPCQRFKIAERGRLQKGYFADMVLFDPKTITDNATVKSPRAYSEGVYAVWVNGSVAVWDGRPTDVLAGRCV